MNVHEPKPRLFRYTPMWWACSSDERCVNVRCLYLGKTLIDAYDLWARAHGRPLVAWAVTTT